MKSKTLLATTIAVFATFVITSCGQPSGKVTAVQVSAAASEVDYKGTLQLAAEVTGEGSFSKDVVWSLSDEDFGSISDSGLFTSTTEDDGYVVVYATSKANKDVKGSLTLKLYGAPNVTSITANDITLTYFDEPGSATATYDVKGTGKFNSAVTFEVEDESVATVDENGVVTAADAGETNLLVKSVSNPNVVGKAKITVSGYANNYISYVKASYADRTDILGKLEKYAVDTGLTGLPIYGDGGFGMYADNVQKGTNTYIPGYGFGAIAEGSITADLPGEKVDAWKRYWHMYETDDPGTILYMNDKGAVVGDLVGYVASSYFDTRMNETKDGYEWFGLLSETDRPIPVDPDEYGFSTTYKFPVKVGADLKYSTSTSVARLAKYNNQEVKLEDYITPYQIYYTKAYGLARTSENLTGASSLVGTKAYVAASADGFNAAAWEKVGIKAYVDETDGKSYLEFTFNTECNTFYAMYYLSSGMFAPVPQQFILDCGGEGNTDLKVGVANWGTSNTAGTESPADHYLSTGPYEFEAWNANQNIVFKRNHNNNYGDRYQVAGIHCNIFPAAKEDENAGIKEFLAGNLSSTGIPSDYLAQYRDDPRAFQTSNSSVYKLNVNTCDAELWEQLFGENGSIEKTPKADYWEVEPAMAIPEFVKGINYSLNRQEISVTHGRAIGYEYFGDSYMSDPENGISYNSTQQHKDAIADFVAGTDGYGYSLALAQASFKSACDQLIDNGDYNVGDTVTVEIAWQTASQAEAYSDINKYIEDAFNSCGGQLTLKVENFIPSVWSDVYYKKMMIGQFDIGFGSISGNTLNPINFLEVLKSDNSSGFTLNWGVDTSEVSEDLFYDNRVWSFDSLWQAADQGGLFENSQIVELITVEKITVTRTAEGGLVVELYVDEKYFDDDNMGYVFAIVLYGYTDSQGADYTEVPFEFYNDDDSFADGVSYDETKGCYVIEIDAAIISAWINLFPQDNPNLKQGFDLYAYEVLNGEDLLGSGGYFLGTYWKGTIPPVPGN